ncbi:MAG TPA: pilin [Candidatus Acidoferrales bacterium]|nr:pilin [Candidatus Acidoferrales bacterium]
MTKTAYAKSCTANGHECTGQTYCKDTKNGGDCSAFVGFGTPPTCACAPKQTTGSCTSDNQCSTNYCTNKNGGGECSNSGGALNPTYNCICGQKQTKGSCSTDAQCSNGTYCEDNKGGGSCPPFTGFGTQPSCSCKAKQTKGSCAVNSQCANGYYCGAAGGGECPPFTGFNSTQTICACVKNGTNYNSAPTPLPGPPSPPCQNWSNGECLTFTSAFGPIATNPSGFVKTIFGILLSISGGIALLLIIKAGYQLMTSQGKPEQIQQGRDQLIAAIVGLIFLIFSFVFLQLIGFDILHIYGFGA